MSDAVSRPGAAVPGSVSNLGPGFDALSVAVQVYLHVRVARAQARRSGHDRRPRSRGPRQAATTVSRPPSVTPARASASRSGRAHRGAQRHPDPRRASAAAARPRSRASASTSCDRPASRSRTCWRWPRRRRASGQRGRLAARRADGELPARRRPRHRAHRGRGPPTSSSSSPTPDAELETAHARRVLPSEITHA